MNKIARIAALTALVASFSASGRSAPNVVPVQVLALNDLHGHLEPPQGSNGLVGSEPAGGIEFLATHIARLRASNPRTIVVSAGDNIGASPLLSGMFHDEPTIEALNALGLDASAVGNHELDEGWWELVRMKRGGCHVEDGCQDGTPFLGATFEWLGANLFLDSRSLFPASMVKTFNEARVGIIGLTLANATDLVSSESLRGIRLAGEVESANTEVARLVAEGVRAIVVLIHQGGLPATNDVNSCDGLTGPIVDIAQALSDDVDVVVSGHTHRAYVCNIDSKLVTSAASTGRIVTDIDLEIDTSTGDVVSKRANNVVVSRDVPADAVQTTLLDGYRPFYVSKAGRRVGSLTASIPMERTPLGESAIGNLVADAYLEACRAHDASVIAAFTNPGGIRADLTGLAPERPGAPRVLTYAQLFDALPFSNRVQVRTISGAMLLRMLEQQFDNPLPRRRIMLQISGMRYEYDASAPAGTRIDSTSVTIGGTVIERNRNYRVASNDFLWGGGDGFIAARSGTAHTDCGVDVDVAAAYFATHSPVSPTLQSRIVQRPR